MTYINHITTHINPAAVRLLAIVAAAIVVTIVAMAVLSGTPDTGLESGRWMYYRKLYT